MGARFTPNVLEAHKSFWTHPMVLLSDEAELEARFDPFGDSANPNVGQVHSSAKDTIGSEIILDTPDGTPK
jgi:hypothetical protein